MIAGTLAVLEDTCDEPLESKGNDSFTTLDVQETFSYLDDRQVQQGMACSRVESKVEEIYVNGTDIDVEMVGSVEQAHTEWVADVVDAGFVAAERTAGSDPEFPFDMFRAICGTQVDPVRINPGAFVRAQQDDGRDVDIWYAGTKQETESDLDPDDVDMAYGRKATTEAAKDAEIGVGFKTPWNNTTVKGVMYASGYVAIHNDSWGPMQFARFVSDAILPHTSVPDVEDSGEQQTLEDDEDEECDRCGREADLSDYDGHRYCAVCIDYFDDDETDGEPGDEFENLDTVNVTDGGETDG